MFRKWVAVIRLGVCLLAACLLHPAYAQADTFPNKPLRLIVPFPAGSASDSAARILAKAMGEDLRQPVMVDNKPGASGILGVEAVKNAAGDPYTLLVTASTTHAANLSLFKKLPYDPVKDFTPLAKMGVTAFVLSVRPDFPAKTTQEFLTYARGRSGKLNYGFGTAGQQASGALLTKLGNFQATPVRYKGGPPTMTDLLAGVIDFAFVDIGNATVQMKAGKLKGLGITMSRRTVLEPDLPTLEEGGLAGFEIVPWVGLLAPAGLPPEATRKLEAAAVKSLRNKDIQAQLIRIGLDPEPTDGKGLADTITADIKLWARVLKDAGVEPE